MLGLAASELWIFASRPTPSKRRSSRDNAFIWPIWPRLHGVSMQARACPRRYRTTLRLVGRWVGRDPRPSYTTTAAVGWPNFRPKEIVLTCNPWRPQRYGWLAPQASMFPRY